MSKVISWMHCPHCGGVFPFRGYVPGAKPAPRKREWWWKTREVSLRAWRLGSASIVGLGVASRRPFVAAGFSQAHRVTGGCPESEGQEASRWGNDALNEDDRETE